MINRIVLATAFVGVLWLGFALGNSGNKQEPKCEAEIMGKDGKPIEVKVVIKDAD